jgi:hypothetical protein
MHAQGVYKIYWAAIRRSDEAQTDICVMHFKPGASAAGFEF